MIVLKATVNILHSVMKKMFNQIELSWIQYWARSWVRYLKQEKFISVAKIFFSIQTQSRAK